MIHFFMFRTDSSIDRNVCDNMAFTDQKWPNHSDGTVMSRECLVGFLCDDIKQSMYIAEGRDSKPVFDTWIVFNLIASLASP